MTYRPGGIYSNVATGDRWFVPRSNKWTSGTPPELVVKQREDNPTQAQGILRELFEADYEDTGESMPVTGTATFQ